MKKLTIAALCAACSVTPAWSQSATGVGVGIAKSSSSAAAGAVAIGGGNATGGQGGAASSSLTLTSTAPAVQTLNQTVSGTQTLKNVPTVFAPSLAAAGLETCLGSISAGAGVVGTGATFGTTIPDAGCAARLDARTLWSMGLKRAAVARLCLMTDIYNSMPEICVQYLPQRAPYATPAVAAYAGGPIMLVEGKTGRERLCDSYDDVQQRCKRWATTAPSRKVAVAKIPTPAPQPSLPKVITDPPPPSPNQAAAGQAN